MGVGGHFWEILKPYARYEGFDFLRDKKVAVDLSFWIVQHENAIKANARNPHLRLTFFRTINLFSKFGAFPVFIADGSPSPLKSEARIRRFFRSSGIDVASLPAAEESVPVERNRAFQKCVEECVEMLKLLGMPVLTAKGEAEALCSQLNAEGLVDACITADSDALLYGASCVIKSFRPDSKEPFECYYMSDISDGLGLKRKHLVAISLLVGNDFDLDGVQGIGVDTAVRCVERFNEDEIFDRLNSIGSGIAPLDVGSLFDDKQIPSPNKDPRQMKIPHCSFCGHPGNKTAHHKVACGYCLSTTAEGCNRKPAGFKCECSSCELNQKEKEKKKDQNWHLRVCGKIATKSNFPKNEIIEMYMARNDENYELSWGSPQTDSVVEFLAYHQHWSPSYIRQRMLPMLSTVFLREMAENPTSALLYGHYEFNSIERVKLRYGHPVYVVKWKKSSCVADNVGEESSSGEPASQPMENEQTNEPDSESILDDPDGFQIHVEGGISFLLTDENVELVHHAFPEKVSHFLKNKGVKESKRKAEKSESPSSRGHQLTITGFFQSTKLLNQGKVGEHSDSDAQKLHTETSKGKSPTSPNLPKSVRRRLLFD